MRCLCSDVVPEQLHVQGAVFGSESVKIHVGSRSVCVLSWSDVVAHSPPIVQVLDQERDVLVRVSDPFPRRAPVQRPRRRRRSIPTAVVVMVASSSLWHVQMRTVAVVRRRRLLQDDGLVRLWWWHRLRLMKVLGRRMTRRLLHPAMTGAVTDAHDLLDGREALLVLGRLRPGVRLLLHALLVQIHRWVVVIVVRAIHVHVGGRHLVTTQLDLVLVAISTPRVKPVAHTRPDQLLQTNKRK